MFGSYFRQDEFVSKLTEIRRKNKPAEDQGKTECCRSGVCCWRRPCDLGQEDPPKIAAHLGITEPDLFDKFLSVNTGPGGAFNLHPRRVEHAGGKMLSADETFDINTPCVFLDVKNGNACKIHDVKPRGGRDYECWEEGSGVQPDWTREQLIALGWDGVNPDDGGSDNDWDDADCGDEP